MVKIHHLCHQWMRYVVMPADRFYYIRKLFCAWIHMFVADSVVGMDAISER